MSARPIRVASWPHWYAPNRYLDLFYGALERFGIDHVRDVPLDWSAPALAQGVEVVHLHWAYAYWRGRPRGVTSQLFAVLRLARFLAGARQRGVPVIWTVHNLVHHEGNTLSDRAGVRLLHRTADLRIFHSDGALAAARDRYGRGGGDVLVMPHGNYDGALPLPAQRALTTSREKLPQDCKLLLCFGQVRPYKGFDLAITALDYLPAGQYHLIIAGRAQHDCAAQLVRTAANRRDVTLRLEEVSEQELADLLEASAAVLLPYRNITTSGVLLAALTAGRGVVASDLPYFREVLSEAPAAAVFVARDHAQALAAGITDFFKTPEQERRAAARAVADRYAWPCLVAPVAEWIKAHAHRAST